MIARKDFLRRLFGSLLVATSGLFGMNVARAAPRRKKKDDSTPPPSSTPEPSQSVPPPVEDTKETAKLRLWKTSDVSSDILIKLRFLPYKKPESAAISPLEVQASSYQFGNYTEVPAGPFTAEISAPDRPTVRLPLNLAVNSQSTLLVRLKGPTLTAEWIDDTPNSADAGYEFGAYNLLFASGDIQVDFGTLMTAHLSPGRSSAHLSGIKRGPYSITTSGVDGAGKSFHWTTEVDFRQYRKAALLIIPDAYGRIRPRITTA